MEEIIDMTPEGNVQQASQTMSGEVFSEYGVVDLSEYFPARNLTWTPEFGDQEKHVVVPFRVVVRGLKSRRMAQNRAEALEEEQDGTYKPVLLSDMRGI